MRIDKDEKDGNIKGYKLKTVNFWILAVELVLVIAFAGLNRHMASDFEEMMQEVEGYRETESDIFGLQQKADEMMELARSYVTGGQSKYITDYFAQATESGGRWTIAANFKKRFGMIDRGICDLLSEATADGEKLNGMEMEGMKLMAEGSGADESVLPEEIRVYDLPPEDQALSPEQKVSRAREILFGTDYILIEQQVKMKYTKVEQWVEAQAQKSQDERGAAMNRLFATERVLLAVMFLIIAGIFVFMFGLVLAPLNLIIKQLKEQKPVEVRGFYEMKYLADTYNDICRINAASKLELNQQANYDALTGILNRGSFNRMCDFLRGSLQPLVFMLIDVDVFKSINDNYGHNVGDQALIKMAQTLKGAFREDDYTVRYGGDEFAVLMVGAKPTDKGIIADKINQMNRILAHPTEDEEVPPFSISVGVAFSPKGYSEELFHMADEAVYYTKSHGRCGYTFYQKGNMVKVDSPVGN